MPGWWERGRGPASEQFAGGIGARVADLDDAAVRRRYPPILGRRPGATSSLSSTFSRSRCRQCRVRPHDLFGPDPRRDAGASRSTSRCSQPRRAPNRRLQPARLGRRGRILSSETPTPESGRYEAVADDPRAMLVASSSRSRNRLRFRRSPAGSDHLVPGPATAAEAVRAGQADAFGHRARPPRLARPGRRPSPASCPTFQDARAGLPVGAFLRQTTPHLTDAAIPRSTGTLSPGSTSK